jgi:UPF0271 protein
VARAVRDAGRDTGAVPPTIDLNADVGEDASPGGDDEPLLGVVTSASVACGFHAGDASVMRTTVEAAAQRGVAIGAHPSYADRDGFGRVDIDVPAARLRDDIVYQIGALQGIARSCGTTVRYVKPHGALYNRLWSDDALARTVCEAVRVFEDLTLLVGAGSVGATVAAHLGVPSATEAFADRAYRGDGSLLPRNLPGAVIEDPYAAVAQALSIAVEGRVATVDGVWLELSAHSICVHGDTPGALAIATRVRAALTGEGLALAPFAP